MPTKIYRFIDHSKRPSHYVYVCANSQKTVCEIVDKPLSHIKNSLMVLSGTELEQFHDMNLGETRTKPTTETTVSTTIRERDLHKISALGHINAALRALQDCDIGQEHKERLVDILEDLRNLRGDLSEHLLQRYSKFHK